MDPSEPGPTRSEGEPPRPGAAVTRRDVAAFSAAALATGVARWVGGGWGGRSVGDIALWAADRAAHEVVGLDADGFVVRRATVRAPVRVEARAGGLVRVLSSVDLWAGGRHEAVLIDASGAIVAREPASPPRARLRRDPPLAEAFAPALIPRSLPAATDLLRAPRRPGGPLRAWVSRPAPAGRGQYVELWLERGRGPELARRARVRGVHGFLVPGASSPVAGRGVWAIGARQLHVTALDGRGRREWSVEVRDAEGATAALPIPGGGAWIAARGALVRLGLRGERLPGQGGFAEVVDLARAR